MNNLPWYYNIFNPEIFKNEGKESMTREEAIKDIQYVKLKTGYADEALDIAIKALEQEPKTGHWIDNGICYECSECGIIRAKGKTGKYNYCPSCGCAMVEPQESEG